MTPVGHPASVRGRAPPLGSAGVTQVKARPKPAGHDQERSHNMLDLNQFLASNRQQDEVGPGEPARNGYRSYPRHQGRMDLP